MTPIRAERKRRQLTLVQAAGQIGIDPSTLAKIERGDQLPSRETARAIFDLYEGTVPIGAIYDPLFPPHAGAPESAA